MSGQESAAMDMNPDTFDKPVRRPALKHVIGAFVLVIFFGFGVHGFFNAGPSSRPVSIAAEDGLAELPKNIAAPESSVPEYGQHDPGLATEAAPPPPRRGETNPTEDGVTGSRFREGINEHLAQNPPGSDLNPNLVPENESVFPKIAESAEPGGTPGGNLNSTLRSQAVKQYFNQRTSGEILTRPSGRSAAAAPANNAAAPNSPVNGTPGGVPGGLPGYAPTPPPTLAPATPQDVLRYNLQNAQDDKESFARQNQGGIYNSQPPHLARSPYIVRQGTMIPVIIEKEINSDLPGFASALVLDNVYDSVAQLALLIPKGSRIILSYNSNVRFGQERLQLSARRILLPDYKSVVLDGALIHDKFGNAGLGEPDININNHYDRVIKGGVVAGLVRYGAGRAAGGDEGSIAAALAEGFGNVSEDAAEIYLRRFADIQPTITARAGTSALVILTKDLILPPYRKEKTS